MNMNRHCILALIILSLLLLLPLKGYPQDEMLIGLMPEENIFRQMERHRPLAAYLSNKLGVKVKLTILSRYGDVIDKFVSRNMDGAFFGGFTTVLAMEKLSVEPIARATNLDGSSTVQTYIFVRKDSAIKTVKDMKGMRMAFVDRAAVSGYLFVASLLKENGVKDIDHYFKEYFFTGSNDSAVYSVLDNRADIGTAKSRIYNRLIKKDPTIKNELTVIATSPSFPDTILCIKKDMPSGTKAKIKEILLDMDRDAEGKDVLRKLEALKFVPTGKDDLQPILSIIRQAGIDIRTYQYK
jgi:phosphonate transport system substrate-binding protein